MPSSAVSGLLLRSGAAWQDGSAKPAVAELWVCLPVSRGLGTWLRALSCGLTRAVLGDGRAHSAFSCLSAFSCPGALWPLSFPLKRGSERVSAA